MTADDLRVAMLSVHTSPLDQPGTGDAGGMNVYVADLAAAMARRGAEVSIYTRATAPDMPDAVALTDGVTVRHVPAGPQQEMDKGDLPGQVHAFADAVLRDAADRGARYDVVHSHYWLSGQVGLRLAARWQVPLVHTMHTLARVKNAVLPPGDSPEPAMRISGEDEVVTAADALIANTPQEAGELVGLYGADASRVRVIAPGVDHELFLPAGAEDRARARAELGLTEPVLLFVGRVQPLKSPDVLVRALGILRERDRPVPVLVVVGGLSGPRGGPEDLVALARECGVGDRVRMQPPAPRAELAPWYRAADLVAIPSRTESFGLVALEAQACGTPVLAADVGGLSAVVQDGVTGVLVPGHEPERWADAVDRLLADEVGRAEMGRAAERRALGFDWSVSAAQVLEVYRGVIAG